MKSIQPQPRTQVEIDTFGPNGIRLPVPGSLDNPPVRIKGVAVWSDASGAPLPADGPRVQEFATRAGDAGESCKGATMRT